MIREDKKMTSRNSNIIRRKASGNIKAKKIVFFDALYSYDDKLDYFQAKKIDESRVELTRGLDKHKTVVEPDFLIELQKIVARNDLARYNGQGRIKSILPDIVVDLAEALDPTREHVNVEFKYESGNVIRFSRKNPATEWIKEVRDLFEKDWPAVEESKIRSIYYNHGGIRQSVIYSFDIRKENRDYSLKAEFFDSNNSRSLTRILWVEKEYSDIIAKLYDRLVRIVDDNGVRLWNGFAGSDNEAQDGYSFSLSIEFEDGSYLNARGNNSFPPEFQVVSKEFHQIMTEIIDIHDKQKDSI